MRERQLVGSYYLIQLLLQMWNVGLQWVKNYGASILVLGICSFSILVYSFMIDERAIVEIICDTLLTP